MQAVVLLSGGIDSMACVHFYIRHGYTVRCLFCDYGQPAAAHESAAASKIADYFHVPIETIKTSNITIPVNGEICGRNALLVFQALSYIGYGTYKIILGIHDGTSYSDCTPYFTNQTNKLLDCYGSGQVILETPFANWYKPDVIAYCQKYKLPLELTYSCECGSVPPCGRCSSCLDRKEFLHEEY